MFAKRTFIALFAAVLVFGFVVLAPGARVAAQEKATIARICLSCHKAEPGNMKGRFESAAFKSQSLQISIDEQNEVLKFDPEKLKVVIKGKTEEAEALRDISKGHEVRVEYTEKDGAKFATLVASKPPISVPAEKLITTDELMKLVAMGPDKGKYFLVDSRPAPRFYEGAIPTAVNIPDAAMPAQADKLPVNKDITIIFYCGGVT